MPTLRTTRVFVTALILALSSSATHAATTPTILTPTPTPHPTISECNPLAPDCPSETTCGCCCGTWECLPPDAICCEIACAFPTAPPTPIITPTPTAPPTSTACAGEPASVNPVTSPTDLLQQTITGFGRPLTDSGGSHTIYVTSPAGVFAAFTSLQYFPFSTFAATVDLVPGVNTLVVCQTSHVCGVVPCTSYDLNGNPLQIIVNAPTATDTPTPIPTVNQCNPSANDCPVGKECLCCCGTWVCMPPYLPCCALPCSDRRSYQLQRQRPRPHQALQRRSVVDWCRESIAPSCKRIATWLVLCISSAITADSTSEITSVSLASGIHAPRSANKETASR